MFRYGGHEIHVVTTRFSRETWGQNRTWREAKQKLGCLYGLPRETTASIPKGAVMIVIEMNNDEERIEGIGLCKNEKLSVPLRIYGQRRYDRVAYAGKYRVDRVHLDPGLIRRLEFLCFVGQDHLKRGIGFTYLPQAWLSKELAVKLRAVFRGGKTRYLRLQRRRCHIEPPG